jgi:hypothetical protein
MQRAEQAALAELATLNVPPLGNPLEQLAQLAGEAKAWQDMLRQRVAELTSLTGPDHLGDERARVVVVLLERAMDRLGQLCTALARLDIDERLVQIHSRVTEAISDQVTGIVEGALDDMLAAGLAPDRRDPRVRAIFAARLLTAYEAAG